jgi:hypothetical protein
MLSRFTACCLAVLVLAPFTAPFQTCDLAMLFGDSQTEQVPVNAPGSIVVVSDVNIANLPALSHVGRIRLAPMSGDCVQVSECFSATATPTDTTVGCSRIRDGAVLAAILRV